VTRDHYIRLDSNDYSVHPAVIGRRIEVVADLDRVTVFCDGKRVADNERVWAWHRTIGGRAASQLIRPKRRQCALFAGGFRCVTLGSASVARRLDPMSRRHRARASWPPRSGIGPLPRWHIRRGARGWTPRELLAVSLHNPRVSASFEPGAMTCPISMASTRSRCRDGAGGRSTRARPAAARCRPPRPHARAALDRSGVSAESAVEVEVGPPKPYEQILDGGTSPPRRRARRRREPPAAAWVARQNVR
jgi:hypothetical protein